MARNQQSSRMKPLLSGRLTRREVLTGAAGAVSAVAAAPVAGQEALDTTQRPGRGPNERDQRSPFVDPRRDPSLTSSRTPLQDLSGTLTPADLHFERHHAGVPEIDPDRYELLIHGMVERPTIFSLAELRRFPATSRICFLEKAFESYHDAFRSNRRIPDPQWSFIALSPGRPHDRNSVQEVPIPRGGSPGLSRRI